MFNAITKTFQFGNDTVTIETGKVARQATGAVMVTVNEKTQVLCTVVGAKEVINWGGEVKIIKFMEGYGTSKLIKKM